MTPISEYSLEQLQLAANVLNGRLMPESEEDARNVHKGLMLFRQRLVYGLRFDGDLVSASVQDVIPVTVKLNLSFLEVSSCSCPSEGFCRHKLAVFFHSLSQVGSVATWVEEWRQPLTAKKLATDLGLQTARDLLKASKKMGDGADYEEWTEIFSKSFKAIVLGQSIPQAYVVGDLFRVYLRRVKADAPLKAEWKTLYELVAAVHSFRLLSGLCVDLRESEYNIDRYYRILFQTIVEGAGTAMDSMSVHSLPFAFDGFIEKLKDDAGDLLHVYGPIQFEGTSFYRELWSHVFKKAEWREAERGRLEERLRDELAKRARAEADGIRSQREWIEKNGDAEDMERFEEQIRLEEAEKRRNPGIHPRHLAVAVGLVHQQILARDDVKGFELLSRVGNESVPYLFYWIEELMAAKEWKRLGAFIDYFVSRLQGYLEKLGEYQACSEFTMLAMDVLAPYCAETGRMELYERTLTQTLPFSYREFDAFLFQQGAFDKWVDLQAFVGVELPFLSKEDLKEVQKHDPGALLPLYHQRVQSFIDLKNRGSYREAVRLMKKLRTLYKRIGRLQDWERYFDLILVQTKRLRAFHEECKRGKLIHVED